MGAVLLAGLVAYRLLPVSALPEVDYPTIQVLTFYPGASPDVMASSVTAPLERQFGQVPGLKQMTSNSSFGSSVIILQFALDLNIDVAEQEVQAANNVNQAKGSFDGPAQAYTIDDNDQLLSAQDYRGLTVAYRNGAPVKLGDVARVIDGAENQQQSAWMNTTPAVILNVRRQPGAN